MRKRLVLLVDDERVVRGVVAALLPDEPDLTATVVHTADQAVRAAAAMHPDLVLLDLTMPGLDAIAVAQRLRGDPQTAAVVLVALAAVHAEVPRALALRCDAVVATPSDSEKLLGAVRHVRHRPTKAERDRRIAALLACAAALREVSTRLRWQAGVVRRAVVPLRWDSRRPTGSFAATSGGGPCADATPAARSVASV